MIQPEIIDLFRVTPGKKLRLKDRDTGWAQTPEILEQQRLPTGKRGKGFWEARYEDINAFEQHLTRNGTVILKFFVTMAFQSLDLKYPEVTKEKREALKEAKRQLEAEQRRPVQQAGKGRE